MLPREIFDKNHTVWCNLGAPKYVITILKINTFKVTKSPGGGGGTLIFSAYVGSDPAPALHPPKNIRNFKHPKKIFEILATPKNIPNSVHLPKEKTLKCIEMTSKYSPIL